MNKTTITQVLLATAVGLTFTVTAAHAWPWESVSVTSHYDATGAVVGVEAYGSCGFPLYGTTGAYSTNRVISCEDIDQIELPY